jgi:hypothetical protein
MNDITDGLQSAVDRLSASLLATRASDGGREYASPVSVPVDIGAAKVIGNRASCRPSFDCRQLSYKILGVNRMCQSKGPAQALVIQFAADFCFLERCPINYPR